MTGYGVNMGAAQGVSAGAPARAEGNVRAVSRALTILDAFDAATTSFSLASLARRVGLPRTTVLRLVDTLVDEGMLLIGEDGTVRVGTRLIRWGALASAAWTVPPATTQRLREASDRTGETVSIYVRSGLHRTVIAQAQSRHTLRHVVQVGDQLPLWGGAVSMVLLGLEAEGARDELVRSVADASEGRIDADGLRKLVDEARRQGYAVSHGGREPGNSGLAVPLAPFGEASQRPATPAGLALGGPSVRFTAERVPGFLAELRLTAADIVRDGLPAALR